jgi:hypothetical protein
MKDITSKINIYTSNAGIMQNDVERLTLKFILWSFGVLGLVYLILLGTMVSNIVQRKSLEANARILSNEVSDLELSYLSMSNNVDLNLSHTLGFKETKTIFATRKSIGLLPTIKTAQNDI